MVRAIDVYAADRLTPLLFVGNDVSNEEIAPFQKLLALKIVRSARFNAKYTPARLAQAALLGTDYGAAVSFKQEAVDVVFEPATFYGWRFPKPVVAWLPDFQHRYFPDLFGTKAYWKRELGFRAQITSGRLIMLSSEVAREDCERFYPSSIGRTSVVRFAVPVDPASLAIDPEQVAHEYDLPEKFFYLPNQFWKHKNHRVVIEALHVLRQQGHDFVVAASGNASDPRHPDHYQALKDLVASRELTRNFRFLGMVPRHHVVALMRACAALINPSMSEGWSTTVEEAKTLGVPMLLSDLRVHREQASESVQFFNPTSVEDLAALMATHQPLSASSRRDVEKYSLQAAKNGVRKLALDFSEMVSGRRCGDL